MTGRIRLICVDLRVNYQNGKYYVVWSDDGDWQNKVMMNVNDGVKSVIVTPIKSSMKK
jgi:TolB-like protein